MIRKLNINEYPLALNIINEIFLKDNQGRFLTLSPEVAASKMKEHNIEVFGYFTDGAISGLLVKKNNNLLTLAVKERDQKQGIAKSLINFAFKDQVLVNTKKQHLPFYKNLDFKIREKNRDGSFLLEK